MSVTAAASLPFVPSSFARELPELSVSWTATPFAAPELIVLNEPLVGELGGDAGALASSDGARLLVGADLPDGLAPVAQGYAGHQFGGWSPRLGDGRALLLGEVLPTGGGRRDVHLKGSGRTPFARGGDGKAAVGPMLREYLVAEAMHALGVPTTRALAVVATGEAVQRETLLPGAVLARVASSHLRVGSFQYAATTLGDLEAAPPADRATRSRATTPRRRRPSAPRSPCSTPWSRPRPSCSRSGCSSASSTA